MSEKPVSWYKASRYMSLVRKLKHFGKLGVKPRVLWFHPTPLGFSTTELGAGGGILGKVCVWERGWRGLPLRVMQPLGVVVITAYNLCSTPPISAPHLRSKIGLPVSLRVKQVQGDYEWREVLDSTC